MAKKELTLKIGHQETGGFAGVNFSASNNKLRPNQTPKCYNYLVNKRGLITRKGCVSDHTIELVADTGLSGLCRYHDGNVYHTFAKCGSVLFNVNPTGEHTQLLTDLSNPEIFFEKWLGHYFFFDNNKLYEGNQETVTPAEVTLCDQEGTELTGEKPHGTIPILHNGRLWWIGGHSTPFFSETDYYDRYMTMDDKTLLACSLTCDEADGQDLVAGLSYNGKLIVWKREKMFFIVGNYDELNDIIPEVIMYTTTGVYNQKGVIKCGDGFIRGYGPEGIFQYSDATGLNVISDDIKDELNLIDFDKRDQVCVGWNDGLFYVFYPKNSTYNNKCLAFDPKSGDWLPIENWYVSCLVTYEDDRLYAGWSNRGFVKKLCEGYNDDGATIPTYYETKWFVLPAEYYLDRIIAGISNGDGEVKISWIGDTGNSASTIKSAYNIAGDRLADEDRPDLGGFMLSDEDNLGDSYLIDETVLSVNFSEYKARQRAGQRFKKIKFIFESNSMDEHQIDYVEVYLILARVV
jgi:hypothetical protein